MTDKFQFSLNDYEAATSPINDLQTRSVKDNANYHTDLIKQTTASSVKKYQTVIGDIKNRLSNYNAVLLEDERMFNTLGIDLLEWDNSVAQGYDFMSQRAPKALLPTLDN